MESKTATRPMKPRLSSRLSFSLGHNGQFLFVKRGTGGMAVRCQPVHNVYFARDLSKACQVISLVQTYGFPTVGDKAAAAGLEKQIMDMNAVGFFQNIAQGPVRLYDHALEIPETDDLPGAVQLLTTLEQTIQRRFCVELQVRDAAAVGPAAARLDALLRPHYPQTADSTTRIVTPLLGASGPGPDVFQLLDRKRISVVFLHPLDGPPAELETGLTHLAEFEEPGFLPSLRIPISAEMILDRRRHRTLIRHVERLQQQSPNREIELAIRRPGRFASEAEVDAFYDAFEPFLTSLYGIDADVSLLSPFKRYFQGVLVNRYATNRVRTWGDNGTLRLGLTPGGESFAWARLAAGPVMSVFNQLDNLLRNDRQEPACSQCPFSFVCPKVLVEPWLIHLTADESGLARRVFERECAINRKILRRVCEDLVRFSERNVGDALPLKLQITPARDLAFVPRDPEMPEHDQEGGRMKDER